MIHVSPPRKVPEHKMFTASGKPVFVLGYRKHTLDGGEHRRQCATIDAIASAWNQKRLAIAAGQVGEPCQWRFSGRVEIMSVAF